MLTVTTTDQLPYADTSGCYHCGLPAVSCHSGYQRHACGSMRDWRHDTWVGLRITQAASEWPIPCPQDPAPSHYTPWQERCPRDSISREHLLQSTEDKAITYCMLCTAIKPT